MVDRKFFVEWNSHNEETGAWNYKQTKMFDNYDDAFKEFCNILATYINYNKLDHVAVIIFDTFGNPLDHRSWRSNSIYLVFGCLRVNQKKPAF